MDVNKDIYKTVDNISNKSDKNNEHTNVTYVSTNIKYNTELPIHLVDGLYLGSYEHAKNKNILQKLNITAVLNVAYSDCPTVDFYDECNIELMQVDMSDSFLYETKISNNFLKPIFNFIDKNMIHKNRNVLVHCHAAINRSPTICIAYIARNYGKSALWCLEYIKTKKFICPNSGYLNQVLELDGEWNPNIDCPLKNFDEPIKRIRELSW